MKSLMYYLQIGPLGLTFWVGLKSLYIIEWILKGAIKFVKNAINGTAR